MVIEHKSPITPDAGPVVVLKFHDTFQVYNDVVVLARAIMLWTGVARVVVDIDDAVEKMDPKDDIELLEADRVTIGFGSSSSIAHRVAVAKCFKSVDMIREATLVL